MLSVIKTAIITIIISFISGVLLDNYKNFAPRILCTMEKGKPMRFNNKKMRSYTLNVKNISNKTVHNLNLNVQGHDENLKIDNANITKGLRFDCSSEDNIYNVSIPFLSKNDEFTVKLSVEGQQAVHKPVITLRSPENFKKVYSGDKNGGIFNGDKSIFKNKKIIIAVISVMVVMYMGILGGEYYHKIVQNLNTENEKSEAGQQEDSTNSSESSESKNASDQAAKNSTAKAASTKNTAANTSAGDTSGASTAKSSGGTGTASTTSQGKNSTNTNKKNTKSAASVEDKSASDDNADNQSTESADENKKTSQSNNNSTADSNNASADKNTSPASTAKSSETKSPSQQNIKVPVTAPDGSTTLGTPSPSPSSSN